MFLSRSLLNILRPNGSPDSTILNDPQTNIGIEGKHQTCSRTFITSGRRHLARYVRVLASEHSNECPFPGCEAHYSRQEDLLRHFRTHICPIRRHTISIARVQNPAAAAIAFANARLKPADVDVCVDSRTGINDTAASAPTDAKDVGKSASSDNPNITSASADVGVLRETWHCSKTDPLLTGHYCQHHQVHDAGSSSSGTYKHCASVRQEPRPGGQRVREQSLPFTRYPSDPPVCRCPGSNSDGDGVRCCLALKDALHHPYAHPYHHCGCAGVSVQGTTQESFLKTMIRDLVSVARRWKARYGTLTSPSCDALRLRSKHMRDDLLRISGTPHLRSQALDLRKTEAARFGASIHECLTTLPEDDSARTPILRLLQDVCSKSGELPSSYWLQRVTINWRRHIGRGGEALIYEASLHGRNVVGRQVLEPDSGGWESEAGKKTLQYIRREIITHAQLRHPNVIEFLGVSRENDAAPVIILPFMEKGPAIRYLNQLSAAAELRTGTHSILLDVASALTYLHGGKPPIYHGDIHPGNILIDANGNAVLCDFGFSRIHHEIARTHTLIRDGGHLRYRAPELSSHPQKLRSTQASDIYSLGMTFLSLVTLDPPFADREYDYQAREAAEQRIRPQLPNNMNLMPTEQDPMWELLESMWRHEAEERPDAFDVNGRLNEIFS